MRKVFLAILALMLVIPVANTKGSLEGEIAALQRRFKETQKKIEQEKSYRKALEGKYDQAYQSIIATKDELDRINNRLIELNATIERTKKDITSTKAKIAQKGIDIDKKRKDIGQLLTVIHKYRNTRFVDYVFSANDFSELLTRNRLMNQLLRGAVEAITDLSDDSAKLAKLRDDLKNKEKELSGLIADTKLDRQRATNLQNHYKNVLTEVKKNEAQSKALQEEYDRQLAEDDKRIKILIKRKQEEDERKRREQNKPTLKWTGRFIWPLANGKVIGKQAEYGWRTHPMWGTWSFHTGIDQDALQGTPVRASTDGIVILAQWYFGYGNCVIIDHGDGWSTLYGHLSGYRCKVNQSVKQGETIGLCGSTGNSTEPHVHFEIRKNGETQPPRNYLPPI
jgi:murein DD-endopeptidase MepM/ murein hydrolase activator NlpD